MCVLADKMSVEELDEAFFEAVTGDGPDGGWSIKNDERVKYVGKLEVVKGDDNTLEVTMESYPAAGMSALKYYTIQSYTKRARRLGGDGASNLFGVESAIADASGAVIERPAVLDSAAMGAAYLAGRAMGIWTDEEIQKQWSREEAFEPRTDEGQRAEGRERWSKRVQLAREAGS